MENPIAGWSISRIIIAIIVVAGMLAIMYLVLGALGFAIPSIVVTAFWIVLAVVGAVLAIKIIASQL